MRALADNQNTLNRMRKQVDDAKIYGVQNLVKDLLEVSFAQLIFYSYSQLIKQLNFSFLTSFKLHWRAHQRTKSRRATFT